MYLRNKDVSGRMEEFELSEKCKQGDNLARKELYELYSGRMLGICLRYTGNRDVAQDLLHDGFLKIYASFDKFTWRGEGSLRAWMERVMVNTALQHLRKNDVLTRTTELEEIEESYEDADPSDVEMIPQKVLMNFISELPEGYRTVFNLYALEEKSHKEIAQMLGINEKSSASQLFRAKGVLAKRIKEYLRINM
jgi:RNA polymerase sigma-70 factor (ECF subfamily)